MSPQKKPAAKPAKAESKPAKKAAPVAAASSTSVVQAPAVEGSGKTLTGKVISSKMQKTIAVQIERLVRHETYGKYLRRRTKLLAHDEAGECREGDVVTISECRPISRHKSWRVVRVVERAAAQ
jgi:small subunit ribosomal protein S17